MKIHVLLRTAHATGLPDSLVIELGDFYDGVPRETISDYESAFVGRFSN